VSREKISWDNKDVKNSIRLKLGKRIKELRKEHNYTQERLAETAGIDYKYLQKIEGKNPPNLKLETLAKLAKAFKISLSKLLNFK
jgi:transcriptional regulator with XRE-family HTH domain